MEMNIPMFTYFDIYAANNDIFILFAKINMFQKDLNTTYEKKVVSIHHLFEEVIIKVQNSKVIVSPFKNVKPQKIRIFERRVER